MKLTRRSLLVGSGCAGAAAIAAAQTPAVRLLGIAQQPRRSAASGRIANARDFGARGDGRTDDRRAIQRAIDTLAAGGGGTLELPQGTFLVGRSDTGRFALKLQSNVSLVGAGGASVIKLADGASARGGAHTLYVDGAENVALRSLSIDGNRDNQSGSGHCLKSDGVDGLLLDSVIVRNAFSYGLGFQDGVNRRLRISNVLIHDTGADGIDFKNKSSGNADIAISNVTVRRWGLRGELETQAAIDCRGPVAMTGISVREPGSASAVGVRMRHGEAGAGHGSGGHFSTLRRFAIDMGEGSKRVGISVVARFVTISDGAVSGGFRGLVIHDSNFVGERVRVSGCSDVGILADARGSGLDADSMVLSACVVSRCGRDGIQIESDGVQILGCTSSGNGGHGLRIRETASATRVVGGDFSGNAAGPISDAGAKSRIAMPVT